MLDAPPSSVFSERDQLILQLVELTNTAPEQATDELFAALREYFDEERLTQLIFMVLYYGAVHRFNALVDVELLEEGKVTVLERAHPHAARTMQE